MIQSVKITNYLGEFLSIELMRPELSGFVIKNIDGIGAGNATININERSTTDGALYSSSRVSSRNIVFDLQFYGDNIETIRRKSYKYFPLKKKVRLDFILDTIQAYIEGYVESNEPKIFSKSEGTTISIVCPYPYFRTIDSDKNLVTFSSVEDNFQFPFSNESLVNNMIEFSTLSVSSDKNLYYEGDGEVGIKITMHAIGEVGNVTLYMARTSEQMLIDTAKLAQSTGHGIIEGDTIEISTVVGNKYIRLFRNGEEINILNCMSIDSSWFQLAKGDNIFGVFPAYGQNNLRVTVEYDTIYEGL